MAKTYKKRRRPGQRTEQSATHDPEVAPDINVTAAALLYDMAALQPTPRSQFGYKRAAKAIVNLPMLVSDLIEAGTLREIPYVGPSSERIIRELVAEGRSSTVEAAIAKAGSTGLALLAKRAYREHYLSHHAMARALAAAMPPDVVNQAAYRGDFQMHSTWSDGGESIGVMAKAAMDLGHSCLGITDHSYGLPIARGMSMEQAERQWAEINRFNDRHRGAFRVFKGIEANILVDGTLDLQPYEAAQFEFVVASPHSVLRKTEDQTLRMVAAVKTHGVAILGHPRGRMFNSRPGVSADWDAVFEVAAREDVAIELDGNWHRQDLDYVLAGRALQAGCLFALDSDAHSIGELRFSDYAIAHARLAGIPSQRVINCWSDDRLEEWMKAHHQRARRGSSAKRAGGQRASR
ncbi:MAG: DNA polymerase/3'-5' exonuclease PolX [Vicinamibacterales bacterium]